MRVLRYYACENAHRTVRYYASVEMDDGTSVEVGSNELLSDNVALELAAQVANPADVEEIETWLT